jgi:ubiquinone/menaquinone biosynthesis C-methylase UbiE
VIGYEYSNELLSTAKTKYPNIEFNKLDVRNIHQLPPKSLDIITMSGVLNIFDDYETIMKNCMTWIKPGGRILIFNMFNPFDLDVFIKYKHAHEPFSTELESGWNIVSQNSISKVIENFGSYKFEFKEFKISVDLLTHKSDQVRSWTEKNELGQRFIINGLNIKQPMYLLKIDC